MKSMAVYDYRRTSNPLFLFQGNVYQGRCYRLTKNLTPVDFEKQNTYLNSLSEITGEVQYIAEVDANVGAGLDVLATGYQADSIVLYAGNSKTLIDTIPAPIDVVAADFDYDGDTDEAVSFCGSQTYYAGLYWYENNGSEVFTKDTIAENLSCPVGDIMAKDIDEDGRIDIVVACGGEDKVSWWRNTYTNGKITNPDIVTPTEPFLLDSYPNPFNSTTTISLNIPYSGNAVLELYNLMGQKVGILVDDWMSAGYHSIQWDAEGYSSGIYFYKLTAGDKTVTKQMTLLK